MKTVVINGISGWLGRTTVRSLRDSGFRDYEIIGIGSHEREIQIRDEVFPVTKIENFKKTSDIAIYFDFAFKTREIEKEIGQKRYQEINEELIAKSTHFILSNKPHSVVLASSGAVYEALNQDSQAQPTTNSYSILKRMQEEQIEKASSTARATYIQSRIFNISGHEINKPNLFAISDLISQAIRKQEITIRSAGKVTRRYCLLEELVSLILFLADNSISAQFDSGGEIVEIRELAVRVANLFIQEIPIIEHHLPSSSLDSNYFSTSFKYENLLNVHLGRFPVPLDEQLIITFEAVRNLLLK